MAMIHDAKLKTLNTMIRGEFAQRFEYLGREKNFYKLLTTTIISNSSSNTYGWLGDFPELKEWVGERSTKSMKEFSYTISNEKFESTLEIDRTDIEDDNLGRYRLFARSQADSVVRFFDKKTGALLKNGFSKLCYDGQKFFDTEHPVYPNADGTGTAEKVTNIYGQTDGNEEFWYLLSLDGPLNPFILQERMKPEFDSLTDAKDSAVFMKDKYLYGIRYRGNFGYGLWQQAVASNQPLNSDNYEGARKLMTEFKRDGGSPLGIEPTHIVVPPALRATAKGLFETQLIDSGKSNIHYQDVAVLVSSWIL